MSDAVTFKFEPQEPRVPPLLVVQRSKLIKNSLYFRQLLADPLCSDRAAREPPSVSCVRVTYPYPVALRALLPAAEHDDQRAFLQLQRECRAMLSVREGQLAPDEHRDTLEGVPPSRSSTGLRRGTCDRHGVVPRQTSQSSALVPDYCAPHVSASASASVSTADAAMTLLALFSCSKAMSLSWNAEISARTLAPRFLSSDVVFPALAVCFFFIRVPGRDGVSPLCPGLLHLTKHCLEYLRAHPTGEVNTGTPKWYTDSNVWGELCRTSPELCGAVGRTEVTLQEHRAAAVVEQRLQQLVSRTPRTWGGELREEVILVGGSSSSAHGADNSFDWPPNFPGQPLPFLHRWHFTWDGAAPPAPSPGDASQPLPRPSLAPVSPRCRGKACEVEQRSPRHGAPPMDVQRRSWVEPLSTPASARPLTISREKDFPANPAPLSVEAKEESRRPSSARGCGAAGPAATTDFSRPLTPQSSRPLADEAVVIEREIFKHQRASGEWNGSHPLTSLKLPTTSQLYDGENRSPTPVPSSSPIDPLLTLQQKGRSQSVSAHTPMAMPVSAQPVPAHTPMAMPVSAQPVPAHTPTTIPGSAQPVPAHTPTTMPVSAQPVPAHTPMTIPGSAQPVPAHTPMTIPVSAQPVPAHTPMTMPVSAQPVPAHTPMTIPVSAQPVPAHTPTTMPVSAQPVPAHTPMAMPVSAQPVPAHTPTTMPVTSQRAVIESSGASFSEMVGSVSSIQALEEGEGGKVSSSWCSAEDSALPLSEVLSAPTSAVKDDRWRESRCRDDVGPAKKRKPSPSGAACSPVISQAEVEARILAKRAAVAELQQQMRDQSALHRRSLQETYSVHATRTREEASRAEAQSAAYHQQAQQAAALTATVRERLKAVERESAIHAREAWETRQSLEAAKAADEELAGLLQTVRRSCMDTSTLREVLLAFIAAQDRESLELEAHLEQLLEQEEMLRAEKAQRQLAAATLSQSQKRMTKEQGRSSYSPAPRQPGGVPLLSIA